MPSELILATWNVNSIRVRMGHLLRFLVEWRPDVLCLQETKVTNEQFPLQPIEALGYQAAVHGQKTYNGVAILSPHPITEVTLDFGEKEAEAEKRLIAATVGGLRVINAYVPNGGSVGSDKFAFKLDFYRRLRAYLERAHKTSQPLALVGDFNVAPAPEDVYDPDKLDGTVCYHPDERAGLEHLCGWGLTDLFRHFDDGPGHYTWWDYRTNAFPRNAGLRIDHILVSPALEKRATACRIEREERAREKASDHVPVLGVFAAK